jgi:DNA-binding MarR family transcriptional regulator
MKARQPPEKMHNWKVFVPPSLLSARDLTLSQFKVLLGLMYYTTSKEFTFVGQEKLAQMINLCERIIPRTLTALEQKGYIRTDGSVSDLGTKIIWINRKRINGTEESGPEFSDPS